MLECGLPQVAMARAITELQYAATISGYRQSHVCSTLKYLPTSTQPTKLYERKERYDNESGGAGEMGQWPLIFAILGLLS